MLFDPTRPSQISIGCGPTAKPVYPSGASRFPADEPPVFARSASVVSGAAVLNFGHPQPGAPRRLAHG